MPPSAIPVLIMLVSAKSVLPSTTVPSNDPEKGLQSTRLIPPRGLRSRAMMVFPLTTEPRAPKMTMPAENGRCGSGSV